MCLPSAYFCIIILCQASARLAPLLIIIVFSNLSLSCLFNPSSTVSTGSTISFSCADPDGGGRRSDPPPPRPPEKSQSYRVSLQYWSGSPEKITKLPSQHSILGYQWPASKTPLKWPMMAHFSGLGIHSSLID